MPMDLSVFDMESEGVMKIKVIMLGFLDAMDTWQECVQVNNIVTFTLDQVKQNNII